eukprot:1672750-Prymnesium_polylepis.1
MSCETSMARTHLRSWFNTQFASIPTMVDRVNSLRARRRSLKRPRLAESTGTYMLAKVKVSFPAITFVMVSRPSKYEEKSS